MSNQEIMRRIRLGEDSALELQQVRLRGNKVTGPDQKNFADKLAAFANARGGTIVLGVDDKTREITGIPLASLDAVENWIQEICNDLITPALDADIYRLGLDAGGQPRPVIRMDIPRSLFVHKSPGGYFRRIGSSKREMSPEALARQFQERSQSRMIRFDEFPVPNAEPGDLDYALTRRFLRNDVVEEEGVTGVAARKLRLATEDQGQTRLTLAGVLLCTRNPQQWLPHACIQAVSYDGERTDVRYQTDARDIGGPLDEQVAEAVHFMRRNMLVRAVKEMARTEIPQFSERAVFEALVNAVAHRDYSIAGSRIRMHMFGDRLELYVPGALANTLTPDTLHLRQANRNELIVSLLAQCPAPTGIGRRYLMDRRGDGVPIILKESRELSGHSPEYSLIGESELRLVIRAAA